jgi:hypothetical protein
MQFNYAPPKTKTQITAQVIDTINELISLRLSAVEAKLNSAVSILDGVSLEELTNFSVPLSSKQTPDQLKDGILLGYRNGKLVEEKDLNGGIF